jgi:DNA-directed RNA polymerase specialized sigma24 family protein
LRAALDGLADLDRHLICQLFWDGRREDDLAREWGVSQQAVSKRKQKILRELRRQVRMP